MEYSNPVIGGFHPDPSICRVGDDYYLVTSTFEFFPGVPVFHSKDLVNWTRIGHCLTRRSQLPLDGVRCSGGIYAPTIRYHDGLFYMVTTNTTHRGNFYVTSTDPAGPWSEPYWVDQGGIDPSLLFDDDGTVYFTSNGHGGIYQCTIDPATGMRTSDTRFLWTGTGGRYPEAPHLYRIGDWYYLMIAEGGTEYGHMETISRGTSPWGPFEPYAGNPILTHRNRGGHPIQGTGHADLIQAHDGKWWMVFLAFRPTGGDYHHIGRETFLAPVAWTEDGWPIVNGNGTVEPTMDHEGLAVAQSRGDFHDGFDAPTLDPEWNFLRNPKDESYSTMDRPGSLRLRGTTTTLDQNASPTFLGKRQSHLAFNASVALDFMALDDGEEAGLTVFANSTHHYDAFKTIRNGSPAAVLRKRVGDLIHECAVVPLPDDNPVTIRVIGHETGYSFAIEPSSGDPVPLGTGDARYLSSEVAGGFTGVYLGLYSQGTHADCANPAYFTDFDYTVVG